MGRIFGLESPFMNFLNRVADLIWLNILTMICCIPVVTIGASLTAMNYVLLKMAKNEEGYITKAFFKSFKQNFKQATLILLIQLVIYGILVGDLFIFRYASMDFPGWLQIAVIAVGILVTFATIYLFPLLARYDNTIKATYKNSFLMGVLSLPRTLLMMLCWLIPVIVFFFANPILPLVFLLGISGPGYLNALLYRKNFERFEEKDDDTEEGSGEAGDEAGEEVSGEMTDQHME